MLRATTSTDIGGSFLSSLGNEPHFLNDFPKLTVSEHIKDNFAASIYLHDEIEMDAGFDCAILFGGQLNHPNESWSQPILYMNPHTGKEKQTTLWWFMRDRDMGAYYGLICDNKPNLY